MNRFRQVVFATVVAALLAACSGAAPTVTPSTAATGVAPSIGVSPSVGAPMNLVIYGAASLKSALAKVADAYATANPGTTLTVSTDSSAALETKIEQGAPADVFLSADVANPQKLVTGGFAPGPVVPFAGNVLVVIVPRGNPAAIGNPGDLARTGVKIIGAGDGVPITKYASQLVANLASQPGYPSDFAAKYAANIVSREDNVAAVVAKIDLGEGDAAIVYATDAATSTNVTPITVPAAANVPATYGGVVVKTSANASATAAFLAWLAGPDGQAILASFGFLAPA